MAESSRAKTTAGELSGRATRATACSHDLRRARHVCCCRCLAIHHSQRDQAGTRPQRSSPNTQDHRRAQTPFNCSELAKRSIQTSENWGQLIHRKQKGVPLTGDTAPVRKKPFEGGCPHLQGVSPSKGGAPGGGHLLSPPPTGESRVPLLQGKGKETNF